ncbi:glycine zipper 2TM domain-containing protein [Paraglaciecola sp.]|uniref:glycine zipper 2TM domain-containing protein n=1 Tax=Paraglaciecola sp. TaxID=1920173 RepID=UPI003EFA029E
MKYVISSVLILLFISPVTQAHHNKGYYKARVVDVTPVYEYVATRHNQDYCDVHRHSDDYRSDERRYRDSNYRQYHYNNRHNAAVLGSVIGGSIGHASSDRKHKVVGTLAGAIIGGVIGHKIDHQQQGYSSRHAKQNRYCSKGHYSKSKQRRLRGYEVTYKMKGRLYQTFSQQRPNKHIRIYR